METIDIKRATIDDVQQLQNIGRRTFYQTFATANTEENMNKYLEEGFSAEKVTNEINDPNSEFYFAFFESDIVGYLKLNSGQSQTEIKDETALEIERIYVLSEYHGKRVGQLLYKKALEVAKIKKVDYMWLGVWEENQRAIKFYRKNGFVEFDKHVFKLGDEEQTDIMMKLQLFQSTT